jgi:hypothetical protein
MPPMKIKSWEHVLSAGAVTASCLALGLTVSPHASAEAMEQSSLQPTRYQAWGYQPWWMSANWPAIDLGLWQRAVFFELQVDADGSIGNVASLPAGWRDMGAAATHCGSALDLAFTLFDERRFEQLFSSPAARRTLLHEILALTIAANAQGVHLDFEIYQRVTDESLKGFREFLGQLSDSLRQASPTRVLSVFGVIGAAQDLFNKAALSKVDYVVVQGYDAHWLAGPVAGSVAPLKGNHALTWEKSLQHYLNLGAERARLLFSVPYYGYARQPDHRGRQGDDLCADSGGVGAQDCPLRTRTKQTPWQPARPRNRVSLLCVPCSRWTLEARLVRR